MREEKETKLSDEKETKLSEDELKKIAGGADRNMQIDGLKGESTDSDHKDWVEIDTSKPLPTPPK
jgi:hypothetical protein